jgi:hypothetical protein
MLRRGCPYWIKVRGRFCSLPHGSPSGLFSGTLPEIGRPMRFDGRESVVLFWRMLAGLLALLVEFLPAFLGVNEHVVRVSEVLFPFLPDFTEAMPVFHFDSVHAFKHLKVDFGLYLLRESLEQADKFGSYRSGLPQAVNLGHDRSKKPCLWMTVSRKSRPFRRHYCEALRLLAYSSHAGDCGTSFSGGIKSITTNPSSSQGTSLKRTALTNQRMALAFPTRNTFSSFTVAPISTCRR